MMNIKEVFLFMGYTFFDKKTNNLHKFSNWLNNYINQLLENLKEEEFIHYLKTIFGALIQLICN